MSDDLFVKWGSFIYRNAAITIPGNSLSFNDVMYYGFVVPMMTHFNKVLGPAGWFLVHSEDGYGINGYRMGPTGQDTFSVALQGNFQNLVLKYDIGGTKSQVAVPFLAAAKTPYSRVFSQVVARLPAISFKPFSE